MHVNTHTHKHTQAHTYPLIGGVGICVAESDGCGTLGRLRSLEAADCSSGQREWENPGTPGHSFILCPLPCVSLPRCFSPLSLSRLRRCLPRLARGLGGARGGAGARSALRAEGEGSWRWAPYSARSAEPQTAVCQPLSELGDRSRPPLLTTLPTRPHAQTPGPYPASLPPPSRWGWGKGAASPGEGERSSFTGWAAREQEKKLFTPAPRAWSPGRAAPRGWGLHLRAGRELRPRLWGAVGSGGGRVTCLGGVPFSLRLRAARGQGERAASHWRPHPDFPPAGGWTLCSLLPPLRVWPGEGAAAPRAPPAAAPSHTHRHTRSAAGAVTGHPRPEEGARRAALRGTGAESSRCTSRLPGPPPSTPGRPTAPGEGPAGGRAAAAGGGQAPASPSARFGAAASPPPAG